MSVSTRNVLTTVFPPAALLLGLTIHALKGTGPRPFWIELALPLAATGVLLVTVFIVLRHAETVAHRLGEPFGTLVLTMAVTSIEVALIVSLMLHGENNPTLARESVFSTVMIVCTGIVGVCLTSGAMRHRQQVLVQQGTTAILAVLIALSVLTLILPNFTLSTGPGTFSNTQLLFVSTLSILLYASFVFTQTIRHRDHFLDATAEHHAPKAKHVSNGRAMTSAFLMMVGLVGVIALAEQVAATIEDGLAALHVAQADAIVGALIATLVLLPEGISAIRAAWDNELQRSLNVALGSALATIGLTIPGVAVASFVTGHEITLGLNPANSVLMLLALWLSVISFGTGRTTVLTGLVHVCLFAAYVLLIFAP